MIITVTREDIHNGQRNNPSAGPLGLAIKRAGLVHCCVTKAAVVVRDERRYATVLLLPEVVQNRISDFDQAKPIQPISFELGLPAPVTGDGVQNLRANGRHCLPPTEHVGIAAVP